MPPPPEKGHPQLWGKASKGGLGRDLQAPQQEVGSGQQRPQGVVHGHEAGCGEEMLTRVRHLATRRPPDTYRLNGNENRDQ